MVSRPVAANEMFCFQCEQTNEGKVCNHAHDYAYCRFFLLLPVIGTECA
jgi:hypothetical protein